MPGQAVRYTNEIRVSSAAVGRTIVFPISAATATAWVPLRTKHAHEANSSTKPEQAKLLFRVLPSLVMSISWQKILHILLFSRSARIDYRDAANQDLEEPQEP